MNLFEIWIQGIEEHLYNGQECPQPMRDNMGEAFKAGMLESARIAEMSKDHILPADDLADVIATQIRSYAKDG